MGRELGNAKGQMVAVEEAIRRRRKKRRKEEEEEMRLT